MKKGFVMYALWLGEAETDKNSQPNVTNSNNDFLYLRCYRVYTKSLARPFRLILRSMRHFVWTATGNVAP